MKSSLGFPICVNKNKAYIGIILIQFINAGTALLSKAALVRGMNSYVFVFYRNAVATLVLAPFAFFLESNKSAPLSYNLLCKIFFVALVGFTVCLNLFNFALKYTTATYASASMNTIPAITFIMAVFSRMERISLRQWYGRAKVLGSMMVLSGAMVIILVKGPPIYSGTQKGASNASINHISRGNWIKGCLIMLSANITWSTWLILQAPIVKQYPSTLRLATLQYFFSSIQSAIWAVAMDRKISSWKLGWDVNLISVLFCGIIVTGIGFWLRVWIVGKKGPVFVAMFTPLSFIITAIFSALLWNEVLHWGSVGGIILLIGGLYSVLWGKNKEGKNKTNEQRSIAKEETTLESITRQ
ncbi:WAT1-related protein At1g43650-like isoform X3 [Cornus florida]|uniref:WAT1-related protein At1g43650-like isoform X3 n=1 Tax=Cornus florida TaxID=4283 RepID=UPI00289AFAD2|nr:WAT1-related protein At1g43650-like isoform X3 [Cornus florida]